MQQFKVIFESNTWAMQEAMNAAGREGFKFTQLDPVTGRVYMTKETPDEPA